MAGWWLSCLKRHMVCLFFLYEEVVTSPRLNSQQHLDVTLHRMGRRCVPSNFNLPSFAFRVCLMHKICFFPSFRPHRIPACPLLLVIRSSPPISAFTYPNLFVGKALQIPFITHLHVIVAQPTTTIPVFIGSLPGLGDLLAQDGFRPRHPPRG